MAFTKDEKEFLLDVLDRVIYESQDEIEGIEAYLNYLRSDAVFKGKIFYTPEMQSDAIDWAQDHEDVANSELHRLMELKNKISKELDQTNWWRKCVGCVLWGKITGQCRYCSRCPYSCCGATKDFYSEVDYGNVSKSASDNCSSC